MARHRAAVRLLDQVAGAPPCLRQALPTVPSVLGRAPRPPRGPGVRLRPLRRDGPVPDLPGDQLFYVRGRPDHRCRHSGAVREGHGYRRVRLQVARPALQPRQASRPVHAAALPGPDRRHGGRHGLHRRRPTPRPAAVSAAPAHPRHLRRQGSRDTDRQARLRRQRGPWRPRLSAPPPALLGCGCVFIIINRHHRLRRSPRRRVVGGQALQRHPRQPSVPHRLASPGCHAQK